MSLAIAPPAPDEYADFHKGYIAAVAHEPNGLAVLERQLSSIEKLGTLSPQQATHRYAEGKWSVKEMTGHLSDSERVLSYRLMRIARGDKTPLPGFDENAIAAASNATITPKRRPSAGIATAHPMARIAANSRKRGGAIRLPMVRRLLSAPSRIGPV